MRIFLPVEREVYDMMERNHWFNEQNNAKHRYWLNLFINGTYPMGLSETLGPMVINHQVWGCPIFRQTFRQRVSLIRDTQSSSNLTLGIFAWNSRVKKGCPKIFGKHSNSKLNLPKMGLSENIGCPEIHRSLVNLPGHRYKIGTVFKHTHAIPNLKNTNLQVLGSQFSTQIGVINPAIGSITLLKHL